MCRIGKSLVKKLLSVIKAKPVNLVLIITVLCLYFLNNMYFKSHTYGWIQEFMICHFNDFICPLFFISYSNILLLSVDQEISKFKWLMLFGFCAGLIWEFFAPLIKPTSTTDMLDLIFYMLGTALYWCFINIFSGRKIPHDRT